MFGVMRSSLVSSTFAPARTFAAAARAPPSVFGSTGKVATKLFQESKKAGNLNQVRADISKFRDMFEDSTTLRSLFINPLIDATKRDAALNQVFNAAQINNKLAQSFIISAANAKLLNRIKQIVIDFDKLATYDLKEVHAVVTSAEALKPEQVKRLEAALKSRIGSDETLIVKSVVDPTILGGLVVKLDQQILDLSVTSTIRRIDTAIRS